jgi:GTP cyclohydrolase I
LGVAVTIKARHFCMEMRGVKTHDVHTVTNKFLGVFKNEPETRAEYLTFVRSDA